MTTEESADSNIPDGEVVGIQFGLATHNEIRKSSISDCAISHASQLANPFLGLPLEVGKCESCGTAEVGQCEGHFGYIELPIPVYHPSHISELKRVLSVLCLKCLRVKTNKPVKNNGVLERLLTSCCDETCHLSIKESKNNDGASFLELRLPARFRTHNDSWHFLQKYGYKYGDGVSRTLLPSEVLTILRKLPDETKRKLSKKGYFAQDGYILRYLPVPPNCLSVPDVSDGVSVMSSDLSAQMLKKVLRQIEIIRSSRSGEPNFESHEIEANELQIAVSQYLQVRGTGKASRDADNRYGVTKEGNSSSTKAWLDKMRTLFISKGSGFSSRSVITGDAYKPVNEIGLPSEIAHKMTFEERVNVHNIQYLQTLVDKNLCLTFRDGLSTYSLREGSKGHTFLKLGQIVHRRIMDGDIVFINRPPTTHKHSLQALRVYIHDGHTVKINPLMCGPLAADFDGDCVHLFYPQSLSARAEVVELFSVENQLLSSHSGNLNLQLATDSLLSLKTLFHRYFLNKASAQQLAMYSSSTPLPSPAVLKASNVGPRWTALQVLQTALPSQFECNGDRILIRGSELIKLDFNRDSMSLVINEILTSLFFNKSPKDALNFFDSLQPLLMENLFSEGFSVGLNDFYVPISDLQHIQSQIQDTSPLLMQLRSSFNELIHLQFECFMRELKLPVANFILQSSSLGNLIDSRSDSAIDKIVQQIGFLGLQLSDRRKFYSKGLVEEVASLFHQKHPFVDLYPSNEFGLVKSCFFRGLDPYEEMVHSIATREVIVRSSKGLAEPGTLFKNLMAILRDVVICYDGSVRNISSNSVIQFEYGIGGLPSQFLFPAGEPVGVLAATAMSNPAYKAVLDSSPNSNSSWDMMKEILFCRVNFKNDLNDRRVILYLNDCDCGRTCCQERASCLVKKHLQKVSLRDAAVEFSIEYKRCKVEPGTSDSDTGLVGHIHLNKKRLDEACISMDDILLKCEDEVNLLRRKKKYGYYFRKIVLSSCDCCFFQPPGTKWTNTPCLKFFWQDLTDAPLDKVSHIMADIVCPVLLDTIIKGDPRISSVNIVWISSDSISWVRNPVNDVTGELGIEVTLEKTAVRQNGDAWRIILDCCLPIFHLIDTKRSIPYAIKQIQDLFGVSCVFDQVVQRLSTSVSMVTKGVLKEHLILLASSMTCPGNLVGFNSGGIKALCRALGVQVPFTEATLYTPRKCFERASEKCHVDSLASIVGSCAWGKHVAVGTGAKFDILWDTKETGTGDYPVDVYNFLQLVRGSAEEEVDPGCLGEDIDKFDWDDTFMEPALSPEPENKAVFDDVIDVGSDSITSVGGGDSSWDVGGGSSGGADNGGWSNWGPKKDEPQPEEPPKSGGWGAPKAFSGSEAAEPSSSSWGKAVKESGNANTDKADDGGWSNWGPKKGQSQPEEPPESGGWGAPKAFGGPEAAEPSSSSWGKAVKESGNANAEKGDDGGWSNWGSKKGQSQPESKPDEWGPPKSSNGFNASETWGNPVKETDHSKAESGGWSNFGSKKDQSQPDQVPKTASWGPPKSGNGSGVPEASSAWGKSASESESGGNDSGWGKKVSKKGNNDSGFTAADDGGKWGQPSDSDWKKKSNESGGSGWSSDKLKEEGTPRKWDHPKKGGGNNDDNGRSWGSSKGGSNDDKGGSWGSIKGGNNDDNGGSWGSMKGNHRDGSHHKSSQESWKVQKDKNNADSSPWGQPTNSSWKAGKANDEAASRSWDSKNENDGGITHSSWGKPSENTGSETQSSWGKKPSENTGEETPGEWDSKQKESKSQPSWGGQSTTSSQDWGGGGSGGDKNDEAPQTPGGGGGGGEGDSQSGWGQPGWKRRRPEGGRGWGASNSGEWKSKRNRPPRLPGTPNDDSNNVSFTTTRKRMDIFAPEEQDALTELEAIMQSIRRIMHQSGFNDGDPLSEEDQTYVINNVLDHHPDKVAKIGAGVDYITVKKHSNFQDSRCFYIVSTDGKSEDFSYIKCLSNLIKSKYPSVAESFISKYFGRSRRQQDQSNGGEKDQQERSNGWGNNNNKHDQSSGWGKNQSDQSSGEGNSQEKSSGWGKSQPEESSGWGKSQPQESSGWGKNESEKSVGGKSQQGQSSGWGKSQPEESSGWGKNESEKSGDGGKSQPGQSSGWGKSQPDESSGWGKNESEKSGDEGKSQPGQSSGWGKSQPEEASGLGNSQPEESGGWGKSQPEESGGWGKSQPEESGGWGKSQPEKSSGWGS